MKIDSVEDWLDNVSISHSNSSGTRVEYKRNFRLFCELIDKTPEQILREYDNSKSDKEFRRLYARYIRAFISAEFKKELAPCTIACRVAAVKSFFKYNDLPLGYIPPPKMRVIYHNRDITHEELKLIFDASRPRERAFFAILAQSGLRPFTICSLKFKHIKKDLVEERIPCKIDVPQEIAKGKYRGYFTFIPQEAVKYLKAYLHTRRNIADDDFLFVKDGSKQQANPKSLSGIFSRTLQKLQEKGLIEVEQKARKKPRDVRLYSLRKFFRKYANQAGFEFVHFWMGHKVKTGQEEHYRPTDLEFHRKLYAEKAMPFLRLESPIQPDTNKIITTLREQHQKEMETIENKYKNENEDLKNRLTKIENMIFPKENKEPPSENLKQMIKEHEEYQKWLKEHPEELKRQTQEKENEKWEEEYQEQQEIYKQHLEMELDQLRNQIKELQNIIKQNKETEKQS